MNINLHNYETFFLLYIDNELSAAEKNDVEEFVLQYHELQQELKLLKESVLPLDEIIFAHKGSLHKQESINETMQEKLLLHLHNELEDQEKEQLAILFQTDKALQAEWNLLQKTTLDQAEIIPFPDKATLYRHEKARLITGSFMRWVVAAALIAAGFFVGISLVKNQKDSLPEIAKTNGTKPGIIKPENKNRVLVKVIPAKEENDENAIALPQQPEVKDFTEQDKNIAVKQLNIKVDKIDQPHKQVDFAGNKSTSVQKKEMLSANENTVAKTTALLPGNNTTIIENPVSEKAGDLTTIDVPKQKPAAEFVTLDILPVQNNYAKTVSLEFKEENDNHIFMMDEENISRSKAAGFLKKLKRTIERTTKIKSGNNLKIAGFEFAVK